MITDTLMALIFLMSSILVVCNACLALRLEHSLQFQEHLQVSLELLSSRLDKKDAETQLMLHGHHLV